VCRAFDSASRGITSIHCLVFWLLTAVSIAAAQEGLASCLSTSGEAAVNACRRELNLAPYDLDIRFALSDALIGLRRHKEAVEVLKDGLARSPGSARIKKKLSLAESYLEEQSWIERRRAQQAGAAGATVSKRLDTKTKLNMIRCTKLQGGSALKACESVLTVLPDDPSLHRSKADALLEMDRVVEAVLAYRQSLRLAPDDVETAKKLTVAQSKRKAIATECQRLAGSAALRACDTALLEGAEDEFALQRRRGDILLAMERTAEAKEAYQSALKLNPDDLETKKKLDSLIKPVTVAKVEKRTRPQRQSKPQELATSQQPAVVPVHPVPEEPIRQTQAPVQTAGLGLPGQVEQGDSSPLHTPSPGPVLPTTAKRYSNRPPVAGITH